MYHHQADDLYRSRLFSYWLGDSEKRGNTCLNGRPKTEQTVLETHTWLFPPLKFALCLADIFLSICAPGV